MQFAIQGASDMYNYFLFLVIEMPFIRAKLDDKVNHIFDKYLLVPFAYKERMQWFTIFPKGVSMKQESA